MCVSFYLILKNGYTVWTFSLHFINFNWMRIQIIITVFALTHLPRSLGQVKLDSYKWKLWKNLF